MPHSNQPRIPTDPSILQKVSDALQQLDEKTRPQRVSRIDWLGNHERLPSAIMGRAETLQLLREAREVFINGHFAAALVIATAVIEHSIVEELHVRGLVKGKPTLSRVLEIAEEHAVLPADWFGPIRVLVNRRNPYAHFKLPGDDGQRHSLGARIMSEQQHPDSLLEDDACSALVWMYQVFRQTLREIE